MKMTPMRPLAMMLALALAGGTALASDNEPGQQGKNQGITNAVQPSKGQVEQLIRNWPEVSRTAAQQTIQTYGQPDGASPSMLMWSDAKQWNHITVSSQPIDHRFPMPHKDVLAQTLYMNVSADKFDELAHFDGSVIVDRTKGTVTARCDTEAANLLALNLANDIVNERKNVDEAREYFAQAMQRWMQSGMQNDKKDPYMQRLQFEPIAAARAGDPDERFNRVAQND